MCLFREDIRHCTWRPCTKSRVHYICCSKSTVCHLSLSVLLKGRGHTYTGGIVVKNRRKDILDDDGIVLIKMLMDEWQTTADEHIDITSIIVVEREGRRRDNFISTITRRCISKTIRQSMLSMLSPSHRRRYFVRRRRLLLVIWSVPLLLSHHHHYKKRIAIVLTAAAATNRRTFNVTRTFVIRRRERRHHHRWRHRRSRHDYIAIYKNESSALMLSIRVYVCAKLDCM